MSKKPKNLGAISANGLSKRCPRCYCWKRIDEHWGTRAASSDGLRSACKSCEKRARAQHRKTKKCPGCDQLKPKTEFHKNAARPDGLAHKCKTCSNKRMRQYAEKLECTQCGQSYSKKANPDPLYCVRCRAKKKEQG